MHDTDNPEINIEFGRLSQIGRSCTTLDISYDEDEVVICTPYEDYTSTDELSFDMAPNGDSMSMEHHNGITLFSPLSPIETSMIEDISCPNKSLLSPVHNEASSTALQILESLQKIESYYPHRLYDWIYKSNTKNKYEVFELNYVCIKNCHLVWNSTNISNENNSNNLDAYDGCISLLTVKDVIPSKTQYKFMVNAYNIDTKKYDKTYTFKCDNQIDRDKWVNNLNNYINSINTAITQIDNSISD